MKGLLNLPQFSIWDKGSIPGLLESEEKPGSSGSCGSPGWSESGGLDSIDEPRGELNIGRIIAETLVNAESSLELLPLQMKALRDIGECRTSAKGGGISYRCRDCGHVGFVYRACRNRHCPNCLFYAQQKWLKGRLLRLLPCTYYHVVFTIPSELRPLFMGNQKVIYSLFFRTVASTLHKLAKDPKWLGGKLGFTLVLHTWARDLQYHPHLHGVVSAGGLSPEGKWLSTNGRFLFPVSVAGSLFKKLFLLELEKAYKKEKLRFGKGTAHLAEAKVFASFKRKLWEKKWLVYIKKPFGGAEQVLRYLGAYTHRVGLSNSRLLSVDAENVEFRTRGEKSVRLSRLEFLRRFSLHILPKGFTKIRHYGLLSSASYSKGFEEAWEAARAVDAEHVKEVEGNVKRLKAELVAEEKRIDEEGWPLSRCPRCGHQSYEEEGARLAREAEMVKVMREVLVDINLILEKHGYHPQRE